MKSAPLKPFYFTQYESRTPPAAIEHVPLREFAWQVFASATIALGLWYLHWRWTESLNPDAMLFSVIVAWAETMAFIGMLLFFHNLWSVGDTPYPATIDLKRITDQNRAGDRVGVDIFIPTVNEDPELVRYTIRDAKALMAPQGVDVSVFVLDDGARPTMQHVAQQERVTYLSRAERTGFKAGNLRHGIENSSGDFIVILDADTRVFQPFLTRVLGYFENPDVAWVQTPQWFYDLPSGFHLRTVFETRFGWLGRVLASIIPDRHLVEDPFCNDPALFYDAIQRRRNRVGASFCCGAGSIHRRSAILAGAFADYSSQVDQKLEALIGYDRDSYRDKLRCAVASQCEFTPYKFHVSEDLYTSIKLHADPAKRWISVYHPEVLSKMLSPQDMTAWAVQRYKYAAGTLDILKTDNPIFRAGLGLRQRLHYASTFFSYLAPLWMSVFLLAPVICLLSGIAPVRSYSAEFFAHFLPFILVHEIAIIFGLWGYSATRAKLFNIAFFSFNWQAIWAVMLGREIKFKVTPKTSGSTSNLRLVRPQLVVLAATIFALIVGVMNYRANPSDQAFGMLIVNGFWGLLNCIAMTMLILAAIWTPRFAKEGTHA